MNSQASAPRAMTPEAAPVGARGGLFRKYVALFVAVVCVALVTNGLLDIWFSYREQKALLIRIQRVQAESAAEKITQFVKEIEGHMAWATQLPWTTDSIEEWRFNAVRMFRQVPAVTETAQLDGNGREQIRMSRESADVVQRQQDYSQDPAFVEALAHKVYFGPVYFVRESEPYMTLAMAGSRRDYGVIVAQVNLKFIWDVVSQIKVGKRGHAYVIDAESRLIAHPDISLVLRNTDLSSLRQIEAAPSPASAAEWPQQILANDIQGRQVLSARAPVARLGWTVFAELPVEEAYAPLYGSALRSGAVLFAALAVAVCAGLFLARRMVVPIRSLHDSAARIGAGDLTQRIAIKTGDELEALGDQFNRMAAQLQDLYATLERKVQERTSQLELANRAKSRFLAAASHDLRQPLHALGLFVAQLNGRMSAEQRRVVVGRIEAGLSAMNELFNALLDISKLDAGVLTPNVKEFPVSQLLKRIETTFAGPAQQKGLSLRVLASCAWVRSDFILLERIAFNLASNAVRYTSAGGVVVGCRRRGDQVHLEVWDTGAGIPADQHNNIFGEFYRLSEHDRRGGLGLGLAIVDRLCRLLDHPIALKSTVGKGSCFSVAVPQTMAHASISERPVPAPIPFDLSRGKLIVVLDDDPLVLEGMDSLFRSWGYRVVTGASPDAVLASLAKHSSRPDLIISDYRLPNGKTAVALVEGLRGVYGSSVPAILISGDTDPEPQREARINGYHFLHKPLHPMTIRALVSQLLRKEAGAQLPHEALQGGV